jgi:hypothetical protein
MRLWIAVQQEQWSTGAFSKDVNGRAVCLDHLSREAWKESCRRCFRCFAFTIRERQGSGERRFRGDERADDCLWGKPG